MNQQLNDMWEMEEILHNVFVLRKDFLTTSSKKVMVCMDENFVKIFKKNSEYVTKQMYKSDPVYFAIYEPFLFSIELFNFDVDKNILVQKKITEELFTNQDILEIAYNHRLYFEENV